MSIKKGAVDVVDRYKGADLVERVYQGDKLIFDAYTELSGELPMAFRSRAAHNLKNYRIHGTTEGAGAETENLFDKNAKNTENGYLATSYLTQSNDILGNNSFIVSEYIPVEPNSDYYLSSVVTYGTSTGLCFYDENKIYISGVRLYAGGEATTNITTPNECMYIRTSVQVSQSVLETAMITKGSTAPTSYIPYGYKLPLTVTSNELTENLLLMDDLLNAPSSKTPWSSSMVDHLLTLSLKPNTTYTCFSNGTGSTSGGSSNRSLFINAGADNAVFINHPVSFTTSNDGLLYVVLYDPNNRENATQYFNGTAWAWLYEGEYTTQQSYIPYRYSTDIPVYIGSTKLGEEEYVDYEEQKVYKRTENLVSFDEVMASSSGTFPGSSSTVVFDHLLTLQVDPSTTYTMYSDGAGSTTGTANENRSVYFMTSSASGAVFNGNPVTAQSTNEGYVYVAFASNRSNAEQYNKGSKHFWLLKGNAPQASYIPYLQPTDPPVPLPPIPTYKGENTLSSTETLVEVTAKGRINAIYRRVEYLQSNGTQIIVTDLVPSSSDRYVLDVQFTASTESGGSRPFFGCRREKSGALYTIFACNFGNPADTQVYFYSYHTSSDGAVLSVDRSVKLNRNVLSLYNQSITYGGNSVTVSVTAPTDMDLPIALFGIVNGESRSNILPFSDSQMTLYGFSVYDSTSSLTHEFIPVERDDGELGMLDTVTGVFYTNAGTGTFEKGEYI